MDIILYYSHFASSSSVCSNFPLVILFLTVSASVFKCPHCWEPWFKTQGVNRSLLLNSLNLISSHLLILTLPWLLCSCHIILSLVSIWLHVLLCILLSAHLQPPSPVSIHRIFFLLQVATFIINPCDSCSIVCNSYWLHNVMFTLYLVLHSTRAT